MNTIKADPADFTRRTLPVRLASALPDLMTAALALWVWLDPVDWRRALVAYAALTMLVEFVLIHAGALFGAALEPEGAKRLTRRMTLAMLGLYVLLVGSFASSFHEPWVFFGAAWLLLAKAWPLLWSIHNRPRASREQRGMWAASVMYYLLAVGATVMLPLPRLGILGHGHDYGMSGQSGLWISQPHSAVAAMALYFALLGMTRLLGWQSGWGKHAA